MTANPNSLENVPCPMCGADARKTWMQDGKPTRYVRCQVCRTVYASPQSPYAQRYAWLDASFGVGEQAHANAQSRQPALAEEARIIQQYVERGRLLDIGCDLGDFFAGFPDPAWQRHGVELSPSAAAYAADKYAAAVFAGTLRQAGYAAESFDLVTMIDVLYYLDDPTADFREIRRILKPGGWLAVEVSGQTYQLARSRGLLCWLLERRWTRLQTDSAYLFWPAAAAVRVFLQGCGFKLATTHVIASPRQHHVAAQFAADLYTGLISFAASRQSAVLSLAPKVLYLARRPE